MTNPPVRIDDRLGEVIVVIGPWDDYQGDYTALNTADLQDFILELAAVWAKLRAKGAVS